MEIVIKSLRTQTKSKSYERCLTCKALNQVIILQVYVNARKALADRNVDELSK